MASVGALLQAKNNALGTTPTNTIYASGKDLANAQNTYGNAYNYQNLATNQTANLKQGDIVAGGSAVTPGISDSAINNAGAQRLAGNTAADTLTAMQNNSKSTLPQTYQNRNNAILAGTNYDKLALQDISSGYKNQIGNALSNASNYNYVKNNDVGMDNTPYVNAINNSMNNTNSSSTGYQSAVQNALNQYNSNYNAPTLQQLNDTLNSTTNTQAEKNQAVSDMQKYYGNQLSQIKQLQASARQAQSSGDTSTLNSLSQQYNNVIANSKANGNGYTPMSQSEFETKMSNNPYATINPADSSTFENNMTNRISNLYDTQKNNVGLYYQTGIDQAKQQYAGLRNQASVTDQQNLNKLKESMAQQGLFNSGDNITAQTGINNQYANDLSGYNKQEQNYYDTTNNAIAQQKANYDAQQAQAMIDLGYKADDRTFKLANLYDTRNQQSFENNIALDNRGFKLSDLQDSRNQQQFQNSMTGINSQYGMNQDQFNNTLKGTTTTYGMGRDSVEDQKYNNDSQIKTNQINYGRDQDYFNNQLKAIAQQYGMDEDQVNNLLKYAQFNASQDQRQFDNSTKTNDSNYNIYNNGIKNDQSQQQITNQNNQWNQNYNTQKDEWQKTFDNSNSQWQQEFDYKKQQDAIANALAQARAASGSSGSGGGRRSSGGSSKKSSSSNSNYGDYADDAAYLANQGYNSSFIKASMPTWDYQSLYNGENIPVYGGSR